ncbi:MAG: site-specific integrase, partial [Candidatus Krumholzibacteriales bacterium]
SSENVTLKQLCKAYITDYEINNQRTVARARQVTNHLMNHFGNITAAEITTDRVNKYIQERQGEGAANATINRELSGLIKMFNLAVKARKISRDSVPVIEKLEEAPPKEGFFEHEDFMEFIQHLPEYIRGMVVFGYKRGCRLGELQNLKWANVYRDEGYIVIEAREAKNKQSRKVPLDAELKEVLRKQFVNRRLDSEYVFRGLGKRIKDFRYSWNKACKAIGVHGYRGVRGFENPKPGDRQLTFHDLRRTAIRNMIRGGVTERVAMKISGHKTRSVFDRYDIVSDADLMNASNKVERYLNEK